MIRNTFSILHGLGEKREKRLWRGGILRWEDFLGAPSVDFMSPRRKELYDRDLEDAAERLRRKDAAFFARTLRSREHWRLFDALGREAVCLDIESNGLQAGWGGYPTVVGVYDGFDYRYFLRGRDLTASNLMRELSGYRYLITFFGSAFDIPFLEKTLPGFRLRVPHFDLCFAARKVGLTGGLKRIEGKLGIVRPAETRGLDGYDAVLLWERASRGDDGAMELLVGYNREDTVNLMYIAGRLYADLRASTGVEEYLS
jgi:uncharacterized protein YprB with RNaseH-like and TPR domain